MKTGEPWENIVSTSSEANTWSHHSLDMFVLIHYSSLLVVSLPHNRYTEACSTIKAIVYWKVPPCGDESLQYLRKSSMKVQLLLQLQSTPLNNQLCDQIKMLPQGQGPTGIFLPVLEKKSSPLHKARN